MHYEYYECHDYYDENQVLLMLCIHDDHLTQCKDKGSGLGFTNTGIVIAIVWWH